MVPSIRVLLTTNANNNDFGERMFEMVLVVRNGTGIIVETYARSFEYRLCIMTYTFYDLLPNKSLVIHSHTHGPQVSGTNERGIISAEF